MANPLRLDDAVARLEGFWEFPDGYFYRLREGDYDRLGAAAIEDTLRAIEVGEQADLPRRLVSLTWIIPTFMEWQIERVNAAGGDAAALRRDITRLRNVLEEVLGMP